MSKKKFKVKIIEFEISWGSKLDSVKKFTTKKEAKRFIKLFNKCTYNRCVPYWHMYAKRANF